MSISKSLRNRLVGLLVIVSLIMIIVPAMMDPRQVYTQDENAIAVNDKGAVVDKNGQLVSPSEHDYTDLLAPEDDTLSSANNQNFFNNTQAPLVTNNAPQTSNEDLEVPDDNMFGPAPSIIDAQPLNSQNTQNAQNNEPEVLPSAQNLPKDNVVVQNKPETPKNTATTPKNKNTVAQSSRNKGDFALQVGVFSNRQNADSVLAKLKMLGYKPETQVINVNGKSAVRIYAAFAKTREAANSLAAEIQSRTGYKCNVVNH